MPFNHTDTAASPSAEQQDYIGGLRLLANFMEAHPEFALGWNAVRILIPCNDDADEFARIVSRLGGQREKDADDKWIGVSRFFGPHEIYVYAHRDAVCEFVQTGEETVTEQVPVAYEERRVTRPVGEWRCRPVLGGGE